jgi:hypothetical protein
MVTLPTFGTVHRELAPIERCGATFARAILPGRVDPTSYYMDFRDSQFMNLILNELRGCNFLFLIGVFSRFRLPYTVARKSRQAAYGCRSIEV